MTKLLRIKLAVPIGLIYVMSSRCSALCLNHKALKAETPLAIIMGGRGLTAVARISVLVHSETDAEFGLCRLVSILTVWTRGEQCVLIL